MMTKKVAKAPRFSRSKFSGTKIVQVAQNNPRRPGTHGFKSFEIVRKRKEITFEKYLSLGGRARDLDWDVKHGYVKVVKKD